MRNEKKDQRTIEKRKKDEKIGFKERKKERKKEI